MPRLMVFVRATIALMLTGCAVTAPATLPASDDYQGLADFAVAKLGRYRGRVMVQAHGGDSLGDYYCKGSRITLGTTGNTKWLLAHELGHHLNGDCEGGDLQHEMNANAMAIKVLEVWGASEEDAVRMTGNHLLGLQVARKNNPRPGHSYCAEFAALRSRYPQYPPKDPVKVHTICPGTA